METKELYRIIHCLQNSCDFVENKWRNIYNAIHQEYLFREKRKQVQESGGDVRRRKELKIALKPFSEYINLYFSSDLELSLLMWQEYSERINELDNISYQKLTEEIYLNINSSKNSIDNLALYKEIIEKEIVNEQIIKKGNNVLQWIQQSESIKLLCRKDIEYIEEHSKILLNVILTIKTKIISIIDDIKSKVNYKLDLLPKQEPPVYISNPISIDNFNIDNSRVDNSIHDNTLKQDNSIHDNILKQDNSIHDNTLKQDNPNHNDTVKQKFSVCENVIENSDNEVNTEQSNVTVNDERNLRQSIPSYFVLPEDYMKQKKEKWVKETDYYSGLDLKLKTKEKIELLYDLLSKKGFLELDENVFRQFAFRLVGRGKPYECFKIKWLGLKNDLFYLIKKIADQDSKKWKKISVFFLDSDGENISVEGASVLWQHNNTAEIKSVCDEILKT